MVRAARICVASIVVIVLSVTTPALSHNTQAPYRAIPIVRDGQANDINNRGQAVGQYSPFGDGLRAFAWWKGTAVDLGGLPGTTFAVAYGINERGQVVGFSNTGHDTEDRPVLWERGRAVALRTLPGGNRGYAYAINNRGAIAGESNNHSFATRPVVWVRGHPVDLGTPPDQNQGRTLDINDRGQAVGYTTGPNETGFARAVLWEKGAAIELGTLPGDTSSQALAINNRGQIVGLSGDVSTGVFRSFVWEHGIMQELAAAPGSSLWVVDINDRGRFAGLLVPGGGVTGTVGRGMPDPLGPDAGAFAINHRGDIAGTAGVDAAIWVRIPGKRHSDRDGR